MTIAYSYIRFSSLAQRQGRSQQRQMEACLKWCAEHDVTLSDNTFLDEGRSGYTGEHLGEKGQLRRFIDLVDAGKIDPGSYLIVESLDRLSRQSVWEALPLFMRLVQRGIKIVTLLDDRIYTSENGEQDLIMSIFVMIRAHEESMTKSKRSKDNWQAAFKKARDEKKPVGKTISNWMELQDGKYVMIPERANIVEHIFEQCTRGYGLVAIAQGLNNDGKKAFRGGTWCPSSVSAILNNRAVLGEYQPKDGGPVIEDYHDAVVSADTFEAAHAKWESRRRGKVTKQAKTFQVWQGIAVCAACGANMHSVTKHSTYLACSGKRKGLCDGGRNVRMDRAELVFRHILFRLGTRVLVEDDSAMLETELSTVDGKILALGKMKARHLKALEQFSASDAIYGLLTKTEMDIKAQEEIRDGLLAALAADRSAATDKEAFLTKLNVALEKRDDRERANALLKHLKVKVHIGVGYFVTQAGISQMVLADYAGRIGYLGIEDDDAYEDEAATATSPAVILARTPNYYSGGADSLASQLLGMLESGEPLFDA